MFENDAGPHEKCRSCDAPIIWTRSSSGRSMPLDAEPSERGNVLVRDGRAHVMSRPVTGGRTAHHATCPQASQWRRRGGKTQPTDQPTLEGE